MATQVLCAWCEAERRAVPSDELERLNHRSALGGMCWTHAIIRPTSTAPDLTLVPHRGPDTMEIMEALTQPRQRLDDWMRQGMQLFGKLVEENEALQQRVRSAEAHSLQVTEMVHELEREI